MDNALQPGNLIVITGPTASGKSLIASALSEQLPTFLRTITTTTRAKRSQERNGIDYFFIPRDQFETRLNENFFLEHVVYAGNLYGTGKDQIGKLFEGKNMITVMDPYGAAHLNESLEKCFGKSLANQVAGKITVIYLDAPEQLRYLRLMGRGANQENIEKRFDRDRQVWGEFHGHFPIVVENSGPVEDTLANIIRQLKLRGQ